MLDTSAGGILPVLPEGMIHPVVSASALTWYIRYIYFLQKLQFLNNVIINKTKVFLPHVYMNFSRFLLSCFGPFGFIAPKTLYYLAFQSFDFERNW